MPPVVPLALPPAGSFALTGAYTPGALYVETFDYQSFGPPAGLDAAAVESSFVYGSSVTYK